MTNFVITDRGYTGHEHLLPVGLIHMSARLYDHLLGRFLSPDNYVQDPLGTQNFNRYGYALNNPLVYGDPSGELLFEYLLFSTSLGYNLQKAISPVAFHLDMTSGTHQTGWGFDISIGAPSISPGSFRLHYGATYYTKNYDFGKGWVQRYGYEITTLSPDFIVGSTNYDGPGDEFDQRIGHMQIFSSISPKYFTYANDFMWGWKSPIGRLADGGDRYRTTAINVQMGLFSGGINLITGDPGPSGSRGISRLNGQDYYTGDDRYNPDSHRAGVLYFGFGGYRQGIDTEYVRNYFQNELAHKNTGDPYFRVLELKPKPYYQTGGRLW